MFIKSAKADESESFSKEVLLKGDDCKAFACHKAPVRRSRQRFSYEQQLLQQPQPQQQQQTWHLATE
ncbi:hypothetical protein PHYBLDRAFT_148035 [Phycomyces blakesleeanus NRRL 1555(-)]|uniref:Uncharacterized protein n=1 Tax=Phycomyces blakesleeanus (strain ATCC 8743b / DSM 1359 / FGSC 10004 / NBRC 33097 / NRRL 1555) TaxID=763407 RepID=A0A167LNT2_PHYB8|nr:hypothetical protein PHYBLDRAFT_148035 [Phycomyces blakesleeanus NRRL 1555(-)]OAD70814.1 hypothetical protein PHYBLDRAFT_148035 [Phycomyces blakesleeanus NRRL 1555(-)]|eukprot:XP_018288854.1 hypothetical protein PHYBLDRAFT_148035 [Phycomyces blakesleeanus NRRL 1555(-)]